MDQAFIRNVMHDFDIRGDYINAAPYGNGHINDTFQVCYNQAGRDVRYLAQRINDSIFTRPEDLMDNIERICSHLKERAESEGFPDRTRRVLSLIPSVKGRPWVRDDNGHYWRCYFFVEGASGFDVIENRFQAKDAARCFGEYIRLLADIPGEPLHDTIPRFHDTPWRFANLLEAVEQDPLGLALSVREEIAFFEERAEVYSIHLDLVDEGKIPLRVTHNDTKLNNILIDDETHRGLCVIDLDTSMPGLSMNDFGDLMRTSTSSVPEDHKRPEEVLMNLDMFRALLEGFMEPGVRFLNDYEIQALPEGGKMMTMENGMRFLTDYILGSPYYKTSYPEHNLVRSRTQIALTASMEGQMPEMKKLVDRLMRK